MPNGSAVTGGRIWKAKSGVWGRTAWGAGFSSIMLIGNIAVLIALVSAHPLPGF